MCFSRLRSHHLCVLGFSVVILWQTSPSTSLAADESSQSREEVVSPRDVVSDHQVLHSFVSADDLSHGYGASQMRVFRTWRRSDSSSDGSFGDGWFDENLIQLTQVSPQKIEVFRGGRIVVSAVLQDEEFVTSAGATAKKTSNGWEWSTKNGMSLKFDDQGKLTSVKNASGKTTSYLYDDSNRLEQIKLNEMSFLRYRYDGEGIQVTKIDGPEGLGCEYEYNASGQLIAATNSRNIRFEYQYDQEGMLVSIRDQFGHSRDVPIKKPSAKTANSLQKEPRWKLQPPDPVLKRNDRGQIVEKTSRGTTTRYEYDDAGRLVSITNPSGMWKYEYDGFGRINKINSPTESLEYKYNKLNAVTRVDSSAGWWRTVSFDEHGRAIDWESSSGWFAGVEYGDQNERTLIRYSPSHTFDLKYNDDLRLSRGTVFSEREFKFDYDEKGRLESSQWSTGESRFIQYDDAGQVIQSTTNGLTTEFTYDDEGYLTSIADPIGGERTIDYSQLAKGQVSLTWDDLGTWSVKVNEWLQPILYQTAAGQTTKFEYNDQGAIFGVTSQSGRTWNYEHDAAGRLVGVFSPQSSTISLSRDDRGRVNQVTRNGIIYRDYLYGPQGKLRMTSSPSGMASAYTYNKSGQLKEILSPQGKVSLQYNKFGLLENLKSSDYEIQQEFHGDGSLARRRYEPAGLDLSFPKDDQGRPTGVNLNGIEVTYQYGEHGRLTSMILPDDVVIEIETDAAGRPTTFSFGNTIQVSLEFDQLNRILSEKAIGPKRALLFQERYKYDRAGNLVDLSPIDSVSTELGYDEDNRLVRVTSAKEDTRFVYSADDDLESIQTSDSESRWQIDNDGRPRMRDYEIAYDWDDAGNLTAVQSMELDVENEFDAAGQLTMRRLASLSWKNGYLPSGDRLWQTGPSGKIWYAYRKRGLVGFQDENKVNWLVVNYPNSDWPLALCGSDGSCYFLISDRLSSIRKVLDREGKVVSSSTYGPYGELQDASGFASLNMYAGMLCDEHGLYYARRRYYDPQLCRFISLDPKIGNYRLPASHHSFSYAANNPYRYRDPKGTQANPISFLNRVVDGIGNAYSSFLSATIYSGLTGKIAAIRDRRQRELEISLGITPPVPDETELDNVDSNYIDPLPSYGASSSSSSRGGLLTILEARNRRINNYMYDLDRTSSSSDHKTDQSGSTSSASLPLGLGTVINRIGRNFQPIRRFQNLDEVIRQSGSTIHGGYAHWLMNGGRPRILAGNSPTRINNNVGDALNNGQTNSGPDPSLQDIITKIRNAADIANDIIGDQPIDDLTDDISDLVNDLENDIKRLNQLVDDAIEQGKAQEALDIAKKAQKTICDMIANGYDAADVPRLQKEADDLLNTARAAHRKADDANRKLLTNQYDAKQLRDQLSRVRDQVDKLQKFADFKNRLAANQQQFDDSWNQAKTAMDDYANFKFRTGVNLPPGYPVGHAGIYVHGYIRGMIRKHINDTLGNDTLAKVKILADLNDNLPDDIDARLQSAQDALQRADDVLKQLDGGPDADGTKERDEILAKNYQAGQLIFEAQKCRGKIFSNPASAPLTGNVQAFDLLKALNPKMMRLRPRKPESLIPGHPFTALGHPAELAKPKNGIPVPNLVGLSSAVAVKKIRESGLLPKFRLGKPAEKGQKPFHVYEQSPKPATLVAKGGTVSVNVYGNQPTKVASKRPTPVKPETPKPIKPESPPKKTPAGADFSGNYKWTNGVYAGFSTSFSWKQNGADSATVTFNMDGRIAPLLMKHGLPAKVPATVKRTGKTFVMVGDPLGDACSKAVTAFEKSQGNNKAFSYKLKISFTPTGKKNMKVDLNAASSDVGASGSFPGVATRN